MKVEQHLNFVEAKGICPSCGTKITLEERDRVSIIGHYENYWFDGNELWSETWVVPCPTCRQQVFCRKI